ncbi:MAG: hypothetical protein ACOYOS_00365 [Syntrophales bacterium]
MSDNLKAYHTEGIPCLAKGDLEGKLAEQGALSLEIVCEFMKE